MSMKSLKGALKGRASMDKDRAAAPPVPQIRTESAPSNNYNPRESSSLASSTGGSTSPTSTLGSPGQLRSPDYIGYGSMNIPSDRPTSWMSVSSLESSLPSPLFEKDIFDAFPAVPSSAAITPGAASVHRFGGPGGLGSLDQGLQSAALMTPSFDSAFLGSAIHLAGSHKSTLGTPTTATGSFTQQAPPTPKISAAPSGLSGQGRPKSRTGSVHRS
ncbi:hypothetical protein BKA70DRAFT_672043 [Coprinopsis sp. MPI-PUGE-AT-0042]|nr:hypothetical protein BKA70DRAFT_672043 [Coprinopsis sp. MPI-PUGE-AT-0042]